MKKVLCVSRYLAMGGVSGNLEYLKATLDALRAAGVEIGYIWLDGPRFYRPWYRIPDRAVKVEQLVLGRGLKMGRWIFSDSLKVWLAGILLVLANRMARRLPSIAARTRGKIQVMTEAVMTRAMISSGNTSAPSEQEARLVRFLMHSWKPDAFLINYAYLADLADASRGAGIKSCILTHDVVHQLNATMRSQGLTDMIYDPKDEAGLLQKADALIAIQEEEEAELKRLAPKAAVFTVAPPCPASPPRREGEPGLMFFLGSNTRTNVNGVCWFLEKVWPLLAASCATARFRIGGAVCDGLDRVPEGVELAGRVGDLTPEYEAASLVIVPLLAGSGLKIKLVEAFSHGRPVVATSIGLQGLPEAVGLCALCADTPDDFAGACRRILTEAPLRKKMSQDALLFAQQRFSPEACIRPLTSWLSSPNPN